MSAPEGTGGVSQHALRQTPPLWTEFLTQASENITLPQNSFAGGNKHDYIIIVCCCLDYHTHTLDAYTCTEKNRMLSVIIIGFIH